MSSRPETLSLPEVAQLVGVSERTIQRWVQHKKFIQPVTGIGNGMQWRFNRARVAEWIEGANTLHATMQELVETLAAISKDPDESLSGRRWATARLVELRQGDPVALRAMQRVLG